MSNSVRLESEPLGLDITLNPEQGPITESDIWDVIKHQVPQETMFELWGRGKGQNADLVVPEESRDIVRQAYRNGYFNDDSKVEFWKTVKDVGWMATKGVGEAFGGESIDQNKIRTLLKSEGVMTSMSVGEMETIGAENDFHDLGIKHVMQKAMQLPVEERQAFYAKLYEDDDTATAGRRTVVNEFTDFIKGGREAGTEFTGHRGLVGTRIDADWYEKGYHKKQDAPGLHPNVLEAVKAFSYPDQVDFSTDELTGILKSSGELLRILHNEEREDDYKTDWFDRGDFGDFIMGWHTSDEDRIAKYKSRGHREHIEAIMKKHGLPVHSDGRPKNEEGDTVWESDYHMSKRNRNLYESVLRTMYTLDSHKDRATLYQGVTELVGGYRLIGNWFGTEWDQGFLDFSESSDEDMDYELDYLWEKNNVMSKMMSGGAHMAELLGDDKTKDFIESGDIQADPDSALAIQFIADPTMWFTGGATAMTQIGLRGLGKGLTSIPGMGNRFTMSGRITAMESAYIEALEQKTKYDRMASMLFKQQAHLTNEEISSMTKVIAQGATNADAVLMDVGEKLTKLRASYVKPPILQTFAGQGLKFTGYGADMLGRTLEVVKRMPKEMAITGLMKVGAKTAEEANVVYNAILGTGIAGGTYAVAQDGIDRSEMLIALGYFLGPKVLQEFGTGMRQVGKQLTLAEGSTGIWQNMGRLDRMNPKFSEILVDRTSGAYFGQTMRTLWGGKFYDDGAFMAMQNPSQITGRVARGIGQSGMGNVLSFGGRTTQSMATGATVPGAIGYAIGGEEGMASAIGASMPFMIAGVGVGEVVRAKNWHDINVKQRGDVANYRQQMLGQEQKLYDQMRFEHQAGLANANMLFPDLEVKLVYGKADDPGGHHTYADGRSVAEVNVNSTNPLNSIVAHEVGHHIKRHNLSAHVNEVLLGNPAKNQPGLFTAYKQMIDPQTKAPMVDKQNQPIYDYTKPIKEKINGVEYYKVNDEFQKHRKSYIGRLKGSKGVDELTIQRYERHDEVMAEEIFSEHVAHRILTGKTLENMTMSPIARVMESMMDALGGKAFTRKVGHSVGLASDQFGTGLFSKLDESADLNNIIKKYERDTAWLNREEIRDNFPMEDDQFSGDVIINPADVKNSPLVNSLFNNGSIFKTDADGNIVTNIFGEPKRLSPSEAKAVAKKMSNELLESIENAGDVGLGHVVIDEHTLADGSISKYGSGRYLNENIINQLEASGKYNKSQIDFLRKASHAGRLDQQKQQQGLPSHVDTGNQVMMFYFSATGKGGKFYKTLRGGWRSSLIYGILVTKDSNIIIQTVSLDKLNANVDMFFNNKGYRDELVSAFGGRDLIETRQRLMTKFEKYLENHVNGIDNGKGSSGITMAQKDWLNACFGAVNKAHIRENPVLAGLGAKKAQNISVYRSRRLDRIGTMEPSGFGMSVMINKIGSNLYPRQQAESFRPMHPGQKMFMPSMGNNKGNWYNDPYLRQGQSQLTDVVIPKITGRVSLQEFESKLSKVGGAKKYAEDISMLNEMRLEAQKTGKKSWTQEELMSWALMTEPTFRRVTYRSDPDMPREGDDIGADVQSEPHYDFNRNQGFGAYDDASYHETVVSMPRQGRRHDEGPHYAEQVYTDKGDGQPMGENQELFFYRANMAETVDGKTAYSTWDHQSDLHQAGSKRGYKALGVPHRRLKKAWKNSIVDSKASKDEVRHDLLDSTSDMFDPPFSRQMMKRMIEDDLVLTQYGQDSQGGESVIIGHHVKEPNMYKVGDLFQEIGLYAKDPGQPPSEAFASNDWNIQNLTQKHLGHPSREALVQACQEKGISINYVDFIQKEYNRIDADYALQNFERDNLAGPELPVDNYPFKSNWQFLSVKDALGQAIKSGADVFTIPQGWVAQAMYSNKPYTKIEITTKTNTEGQPVYQVRYIDETTAIDSAMVRGVFEEKYGEDGVANMYDNFPDGLIPVDQMPDTPLVLDLDNPDFAHQETHWMVFADLQKDLKKSVGAKEADRLLTDYTDWDMNQPTRLPSEYTPSYEKNYPVTQRRNDIGVKNNYDIHAYQAMKRIAKELGIEGPYKTSLTAGNLSPFNMEGTYNKYGPDGAYPTTLNTDLSFQSNSYALDISGLTGADMGRLKFFMPKLGKRTLGLKDNIVDIVLPSLKQDTFSREQFLASVEATGGAKQYMEELGLDAFLKTKTKFTKDEIESFVAENQIDVERQTLDIPKHEVEKLMSPGMYNEPGIVYSENIHGFNGGGRFSPYDETATGRFVIPLFGEDLPNSMTQNEFARVLLDDPDITLFLEENPDVKLSYMDNSFQHNSMFLGEEGQQSYVYDYQGPFNKINTIRSKIEEKARMVDLQDNFSHVADNARGHYDAENPAVVWHSRTNDGEITLEDGSIIKTHHVEELQADWQKRVRKARAGTALGYDGPSARGLPVGRRFLSTEQKKEIDSLMWWAENRAQSFKDIPGAGDYVRDIKNAISHIREFQRSQHLDRGADPWEMKAEPDSLYDSKPFNHKDPRHSASRDLDASWDRGAENKDYAREMLIETLDEDISWNSGRIERGERLSEEDLSAHDFQIKKRNILNNETEAKISVGKSGPGQRRAQFWKHQKKLIEELHAYSKQMSPGRDHPYYPKDDWSLELLFDARAPENNVIEAPFQKSWLSQAIKAELLEASAMGADYYTWASGDIQSARYDLNKLIDRIDVETSWVMPFQSAFFKRKEISGARGAKVEIYTQGDGFHSEPHSFVIGKDGIVQSQTHRGEHISEVVGEHLTGKIMKQLENAKDLPTLDEIGYTRADNEFKYLDGVIDLYTTDNFSVASHELLPSGIGTALERGKKLTSTLKGIVGTLTKPGKIDSQHIPDLPSNRKNSFFRDQQHFIDEVLIPHWQEGPRGNLDKSYFANGWKRSHEWKKKSGYTADELIELQRMESEKGPMWEPGAEEFVLGWQDIVDSGGNLTLFKEVNTELWTPGPGWEGLNGIFNQYGQPGSRSIEAIKIDLRNLFVMDAIKKWKSNKFSEGKAIFDKNEAMKGEPFVISEDFSVVDPKQKKFYDENKLNLLNKMLKGINKNQKEMGLPEVKPAESVNLKGGQPIWKMEMPARESIEALPLFMPSMGRSRKPQIVDSIHERKATKFGKVLKHYQGEDREVVAQARQDWMDQGFDSQNFQDFMIDQGGDYPALATLTGGKWKPMELYYTGDIGIGPRPKRSIKGFLNRAVVKKDTHRWTPEDTMVFTNDRAHAREVGGSEPLVMASNAKYLFNMNDPSHVQALQKHMSQTGEMPKDSSSLFAYENELKDMGWDGYVFNEGEHEFVAVLDPNRAKLIKDQVGENTLVDFGNTKKRFSGTVSGMFGRPLPSDRIAGRARDQQDVRYLPGVKSTETKNFKNWFGRGKLIDSNGDPIAFAHASHYLFDTFQSGKMSHGEYVGHHGIHFGNIEQANDILPSKWRTIKHEGGKERKDIQDYTMQVEQRRNELHKKQAEAFSEISKFKEELEAKNGIIPDLEKAEFINRRPYFKEDRGGWKGDGIVPLKNGDKFYIIDSNKVDEMTWGDQWEVDAKGMGFSTLKHPGPRAGHSTKTMDGDVSDTGFRGYYLTKKDAQDALTHGWEWLSAGYSWSGAWSNMLNRYKFEPTPTEKAKIADLEAKHKKIYDDYKNAEDRWGLDANIGKYYLNIQNPLRIRDIGDWSDTVNLAKEIDRSLEANGQTDSLYKEILEEPFIMKRVYEDKIFAPLQDLGYDGLVYANSVEGGSSQGPNLAFMDVWGDSVQKGAFKDRPYNENYDSVVAFEPEQIKSVNNSGSFSRDDGNVMMMPWIKMKNDQGVKYFHDPLTAIKPPVKSISHLKGKKVTMTESDRHDTRGTNMGGPLFPYLHSNQVVVHVDGAGFTPQWANLGKNTVLNTRNRVALTDDGHALVHLMSETTHRSNKVMFGKLMSEIQGKSKHMTDDQRMVTAHMLDIIKRRNGKISSLELKPSQVKFIGDMGRVKTQRTRGRYDKADALFDKYLAKTKRQAWWNNPDVVALSKDFTQARDLTFDARAQSSDLLAELEWTPNFTKLLQDNQDFLGGQNYDAISVVQLSKHKLDSASERVFAVYFGKDPKEAKAMSANEVKAKDLLLKDKNFKPHPAYDWLMLGPENPDMFFLDKPENPVKISPTFAKEHYKNWKQDVNVMGQGLQDKFGRMVVDKKDTAPVKSRFKKFDTLKGKTPLPQQADRNIIGAMKTKTQAMLIK